MANNKQETTIRSSAGEYLTFIAATGEQGSSMEMRYEDENIWLTQKMMAVLYDVEVPTINYHLQKIFKDSELDIESTIRKFLIVQNEGNRKVSRNIEHYNLQAIIAVGFKVNSARSVQFRKWVNKIAKDYTIQGWVMDKERLMNDGTILSKEYFNRLLDEVREIRISERRFYQKITDIYTTSLDYDKDSATTKQFYASIQNKLHWAIHGQTAAEVIVSRANASKENMGLETWAKAPHGKIIKADVVVAKNYLSKDELRELGHIVSAYLDLAENQAKRKIPMTMEDWSTYLGDILKLSKYEVLNGTGRISAENAKTHAESEFEQYRIIQDKLFQSDFDRELNKLEQALIEPKK